MIGASSGLRLNQPELSATNTTTPEIASSKPPSGPAQCRALPLKSAIAGHGGSARTSARISQIRYGNASTTITSNANQGSKDINVRRPRRGASANPATSSNRPIAADVVSSKSPASIDHQNTQLRGPGA